MKTMHLTQGRGKEIVAKVERKKDRYPFLVRYTINVVDRKEVVTMRFATFAKALFYYVKELKCSPDASIQRVTEYEVEVKGI